MPHNIKYETKQKLYHKSAIFGGLSAAIMLAAGIIYIICKISLFGWLCAFAACIWLLSFIVDYIIRKDGFYG